MEYTQVKTLCERVLDGGQASCAELEALMDIKTGSQGAALLRRCADVLVRRANGGRGWIYAQIGIDSGPCSGNCHFCGFAANSSRSKEPKPSLTLDFIVHLGRLFSKEGVDLISLMTSASFDFDNYLHIIACLRQALGTEIHIMANTADLSVRQAQKLKDAGATSIYHAVRIGEGHISLIPEKTRWETLAHARAAGLLISSAVGPLYQPCKAYQQSAHEIAQRMMQVVDLHPFCSGVTSLRVVKESPMAKVKPWPACQMAVFEDIFHLAAHASIPVGGHGSVKWVDAGFDPRQRALGSDDKRLIHRIRKIRKQLTDEGWTLS